MASGRLTAWCQRRGRGGLFCGFGDELAAALPRAIPAGHLAVGDASSDRMRSIAPGGGFGSLSAMAAQAPCCQTLADAGTSCLAASRVLGVLQ